MSTFAQSNQFEAVRRSAYLESYVRSRKRTRSAWRSSTVTSLRRYALAALFCAIFSAVYERFSHGVWSVWVVTLFAYPLVLGVVPALLERMLDFEAPMTSRQIWACGVMTLAVGSCLRGVLEIYGTTSPLIVFYQPVGLALLALALMAYAIYLLR